MQPCLADASSTTSDRSGWSVATAAPDGQPAAARGSDAFHNDRLKAFELAVESRLIRTAIQGWNSEAFSFVSNIHVYSTPQEAAEVARAAIAADMVESDAESGFNHIGPQE